MVRLIFTNCFFRLLNLFNPLVVSSLKDVDALEVSPWQVEDKPTVVLIIGDSVPQGKFFLNYYIFD